MRIEKTCRGCGKVFWMKVPSKRSDKKQDHLKLTHCQRCRNMIAMSKQGHTHESDKTLKDDVELLTYLERKQPEAIEKLRQQDLNKPE